MSDTDEATGPRASAVQVGSSLAFALLFLGAHSPWLRAGFSAADYAERLVQRAGATSLWSELLPLPLPGSPAGWARFESLACVLLFALGSSHFLRRLIAPWVGKERARAAALLCALFLLLHPLLVDVAAPESARCARAALALAGIAGGFFLAGRQEGREGRTASALVLFLLACTITRDVAPFAVLFALSEYTSAHRHRPRALRLRTAASTLGIFGAAALLPAVLASGTDGSPAAYAGARERIVASLQELGRLCIPSAEGAGLFAQLASGGVLLLVFQPLFRAARSAPRLWGGLFTGWSSVLCVALVWWAWADSPGSAAGRELVALAVLCAGFALGASALSAQRARWITLAVALVFAPLAHVAARPRLAASSLAAAWQRSLTAHVPADGARLLVLDPPPEVAVQLGWLLHPRLLETRDLDASGFDPERVRGITADGLLMLLRVPDGDARLAPGTRVLFPDGRVGELPAWSGTTDLTLLRPWRTELGTTLDGGLDPRALEAVEVTAELAAQPSELARLAWRTRDGRTGEVAGRVREQRGRRVAQFDLSASLDWLMAGEVRKLELPAGKRAIERAELRARLPLPGGNPAPLRAGSDWLFLLDPFECEEVVLTLLALDDLGSTRIPVVRETNGGLRAHGVGALLEREQAHHLWTLEFRSGGQVLARLAGATD